MRTFEYGNMNDFIMTVKDAIGEKGDQEHVSDVFSNDRLKGLYKAVYMDDYLYCSRVSYKYCI